MGERLLETWLRNSSDGGKAVLKHSFGVFFFFVGVRRLSLLAEEGVCPFKVSFRYHTVGRTGTQDGCCFVLSHDASDSKHIKTKNQNRQGPLAKCGPRAGS